MGRTELEMTFRNAGCGGDRSIALSEELSDMWGGDDELAEGRHPSAFAPRLLEAWELDGRALDGIFRIPAAVADADVRGDLGDMCGRRVA
jgi:hypothetical protein